MSRSKQVLEILELHGHPVVLAKRDMARPCKCRSELKQEALCNQCLGTGFKVKLTKLQAYKKRNNQGAMPDTRKEQDAGAEDVRSYLFYVAGAVDAGSGDIIVERANGIYTTHIISTSDHAQDGQEVVYTAIYTKRRSV
ncbi:hypothetical protein C0431_13245 [bacterium]|nr:hypothetical protein [bacterium]